MSTDDGWYREDHPARGGCVGWLLTCLCFVLLAALAWLLATAPPVAPGQETPLQPVSGPASVTPTTDTPAVVITIPPVAPAPAPAGLIPAIAIVPPPATAVRVAAMLTALRLNQT